MTSALLDWERHKEAMGALYVDENKTLKDVMDIMKEPPYHFSATKKQYERQFQKKWRFRKNLTKQDWKILHFKVSKRQTNGKRTKVFVNGRLQHMEKLEHEISRYGLNKSAMFEFEPTTPEGIRLRSPTPASPGASSGTTSQVIGFVESQGNSGFPSDPAATADIINSDLIPASSQMDALPYLELSKLFQKGFQFPHDQLVSLDAAGLASFVVLPDGPDGSGKWSSQVLDASKRATSLQAVLPPGADTALPITNSYGHSQDPLVQLLTNAAYILYNGLGSSELGTLMIQLLTLSENRRVLEHLLSSPSIAVEALVEQLLLSLLHAGNDKAAVILLEHGRITPHARYLIRAAETGCLEAVDVLLKSGVDPNLRPLTWGNVMCRDRTALEVAIAANQNSVAKRLVDYGADPNGLDDERRPRDCAFVDAISTGNSDLVEYFLHSPTCQSFNNNVDVGYKVLWLVVAAENGDVGMVNTLLSHVDINHHTLDGSTALAAAALKGKGNVVSFLLKSGASPNRSGTAAKHNLWLSPLQAAITAIDLQWVDREDLNTIHLLIEYGADPNEPPCNWDDDWTKIYSEHYIPSRTAIQYAAEIGHEQLFFLLLNHGADPYAPAADRHGVTALQAALTSQSRVLWDYFSGKEGYLNVPPTLHAGTTALIEAIRAQNGPAVRKIIASGCDVNATGTAHAGCTALSEAILIGDMALVQLLLDFGAEINHTQASYDGGTALQAAIWTENTDLVERLIALDADVFDDKALLMAVLKSPTNIFNKLHSKIDARMFHDPAQKIKGNLALHAAIQLGDESIVLKLVRLGVSLNEPAMATGNENHNCGRCFNSQRFASRWWTQSNLSECSTKPHDLCGETPLETTIRLQKTEIMEILLAHGADINAAPMRPWGRAPLQCATEYGNVTIVQRLLDKGADCNTAPAAIGGATALQMASIKGFIGIARMLLDHGADPNALPAREGGMTALAGAAKYGRLDMLQLLLDAGALVDEPGSVFSESLLSVAYEDGHIAAMKLLRTHQAKKWGSGQLGGKFSQETSFTVQNWRICQQCSWGYEDGYEHRCEDFIVSLGRRKGWGGRGKYDELSDDERE